MKKDDAKLLEGYVEENLKTENANERIDNLYREENKTADDRRRGEIGEVG